METLTVCGLPVASVVWQSATGAWALTAICKATFRLVPGTMTLAEAQEPPNEADDYWNDDESRSLHAASDLVPFKPRADVLVVGHAFAPAGTRARSLTVRVYAGTADKAVDVWCDRVFDMDGRLHEGSPFLKMPLRYERAAGGHGSANPVGMAFDRAPDAYGRIPIANLQPVDASLSLRGDMFAPVGLGPLAPHWPERIGRLHRSVPPGWHRVWHARALPERLDPTYFNSAPSDQWTDFLRADERIVLEHLHSEHPHLVTRLPGLCPQAIVERASGHQAAMELVADTLWIDTDRALCTVVWRGRIGLTHAREQGRVVFAWKERAVSVPEMPVAVRGMSCRPTEGELPPADATVPLTGLEPAARSALPFDTGPSVRSLLAQPDAGSRAAPPTDGGETMRLTHHHIAPAALPFAQPTALRDPPASPPMVERLPAVAALSATADDTTQRAPLHEALVPAEMVPRGSEEALDAMTPAAGPSAAAEPALAQVETILDFNLYTIELFARITVSMACRPADSATILGEHDLARETWGKVKTHWIEAMRAENRRGKAELRKQYDAAYVEQLEGERGPIAVTEYARLAVAAERGNLVEVVREMRLPAAAPMRIERVWMERIGRDKAFGESVRAALTKIRAA